MHDNLIAAAGLDAPWRGPAMDWQRHGLHTLAPQEIGIVEQALRRLQSGANKDFQQLTRADVPLQGLEPLLQRMDRAIQDGPGFALLRGLDTSRYSRDELALMFFAIGLHLGQPIIQSHQGEFLGHVINLEDVERNPRGYHTGGHMGMHTDSCDIVALMCMKSARQGGASRIADARAIVAEIERRRPDLAETLRRGMYFRRMEEDAEFGDGPVCSPERIPIYATEDGRFSCYYLGGYIERAVRAGDAVLEPHEREALDLLNTLAASPAFYLDMQFSDGDMQFLNNRRILHGRTDYQEDKDMMQRRHLLRMWLAMPNWPPMPASQVFHSADDRRAWGQRRVPFMDLPSTYLARQAERLAAAAA